MLRSVENNGAGSGFGVLAIVHPDHSGNQHDIEIFILELYLLVLWTQSQESHKYDRRFYSFKDDLQG